MSIDLPHISRFVLWSSLGFILGVAFLSFVDVEIDVLLFIVVICVISVFFVFYKKQFMWLSIVFALMFGVGAIVMQNTLDNIAVKKQDVGSFVYAKAIVVDDVILKDWYSQIIARYDDGVSVLIKDKKYTDVVRGDILSLKCTKALPQNFDDFDYQKYLAMNGVDYICKDVSYEIIGHKDDFLSLLSRVRVYLEQIVNHAMPAPQSALANGLLFGGDNRLSQDLQDKFSLTGMTHIVAVSGYNVSIIVIAIIAGSIFVGFKRKWAIVISMIGVFLFVALIGFPSSGLRAAIMGTLVLLATLYGRVSNMQSAILITCALMLFYNPLLLRYDIGFQLSFLATIGIVAMYPILESIFIRNKKSISILEILFMTISAQIFVLPIIIYHFHIFSWISLLVNILVLPILPITMLGVFLLIVFDFVFQPLSLFFSWISYFLLSYEIDVIDFFAQKKWGSVEIVNMSAYWFLMYYILLFGIILIFNKKQQR
jgi:competence protein ComEC